jgi:uncharacterized protein DUF4124
MKRLFFLAALLISATAGAGSMYRWVDSDGKVHYSDQPPPTSANPQQIERMRMGIAVRDSSQLPYATQLAAKNFPVTLYVTECGEPCTLGRDLLRKRGIPYTEKNPQQPDQQKELSTLLSGQLEVPVLKVGSNLVRGYNEGQWQSALDVAGYPQSAGALAPAAKPPPKTGVSKAKPAAPAEGKETPSGEGAAAPQQETPDQTGPYPAYQ